MLFWYSNQSIRVLWHDVMSHTFKTSIAVKQGGILSPLLFNVYMNELSCILNKSGVGCHINNNIVNHIMYADDMCLIAPCATSVQKLSTYVTSMLALMTLYIILRNLYVCWLTKTNLTFALARLLN